MGKGFIRKIISLLIFLVFSCSFSQNIHSEASEFFFEVKTDKTAKVFVFDGFKLSLIERDAEFVKDKIPVTEGNYFVLFFVKEGYVPKVKVLRAGNHNIILGKIRFEKLRGKDKGFLVGVVYKPVRGGKVLYRKGIIKLFEGVEIKLIRDKGKSHIIRSGDNGVFSIPLVAGKYKIFVKDNKKGFDVVIERGKTTIHNVQKGVILID